MNPEIISIILNAVFGLFILFGFLGGLVGLKKSLYNLVFFLFTVIAFFITTPISKLLLKININGSSIGQLISNTITSSLGSTVANNSLVTELSNSLPLILINIAVYILVFLLLSMIFGIISGIAYKISEKKAKKKVKTVEQCEIVNNAPQITTQTVKPKKRRLLGGLVGALQSFLFIIMLLMPVIGVFNVFNDIAGLNNVSAQTENVQEDNKLVKVDKLIQTKVYKEFLDMSKAVGDSILGRIGQVGGLSESMLNTIASVEINDQKVSLVVELRTFVNTYNDFVDLVNVSSASLGTSDIGTIFKDIINNPENYDFSKLKGIINNLLDSNIFKSIGNDLPSLIRDVLKDSIENSSNSEQALNYVVNVLDAYIANGYKLTDDIKVVLNVFEVLVNNKIVKELMVDKPSFDNIASILFNEQTDEKPKNKVLNDLTSEIEKSNLLQKFLLEAVNFGTDYLEDYLNDKLIKEDYQANISRINSANNYNITSQNLNDLVCNAYEIYKLTKDINFDELQKDTKEILNIQVSPILKLIGEEIFTLVNLDMFKKTNVYSDICESLNYTEYNKYINFNELKNSQNIRTQFNNLADVYIELSNANVITILVEDDKTSNQDINTIVGKLAEKDSSNKMLVERVMNKLLSCTIAKNSVKYALDSLNEPLNNFYQDAMESKEQNISKIDSSYYMTSKFNADINLILNSVVNYLKDVDVEVLKDKEVVTKLLETDLSKLGEILDQFKTVRLFSGEYVDGDGVYTDLMKALEKTSATEFIDLSNATNAEFSWSTELQKVKTTFDKVNEIKIVDNEQEKGLANYLLNGGNIENGLEVLNSNNVSKLQGLFEITLLKPLALSLINNINSQIKDFVNKDLPEGCDLGVNIVEIDKTVDIASQSSSIISVISKLIDINFETLDIENMDSDTQNKLDLLLEALENNAKLENGVFKNSYNALLLKIKNEIIEKTRTAVGNTAGNQLVASYEVKDILLNSKNIRQILKVLLKYSNDLNVEKVNNLDASKVDELLDTLIDYTLKQTSEINKCDDLKPVTNAVFVYLINKVNHEVDSTIQEYNGSTDMTDDYNFIPLIVTSAINVYDLAIGNSLETLQGQTDLNSFIKCLNLSDFTTQAYSKLQPLLTNN